MKVIGEGNVADEVFAEILAAHDDGVFVRGADRTMRDGSFTDFHDVAWSVEGIPLRDEGIDSHANGRQAEIERRAPKRRGERSAIMRGAGRMMLEVDDQTVSYTEDHIGVDVRAVGDE